MKVAISSTGPDLDSELDPRFGRCQYFLVVDLDDTSFEVVRNSSASLTTGAGIQAAKLVVDSGAELVLTGKAGPNAERVLSAAGVKTVSQLSGIVRDVVEKFKEGEIDIAAEPNTQSRDTRNLRSTTTMKRGSVGRGQGGRFRGGPPGHCVCPSCGESIVHQRGIPCFEEECPRCGARMIRE